ncbi:MAG TPA: glutathione-dependent formaldehyde dehydrogenase [Bacteroidetes bacterium]|nr:glutathione-dependent formaldehyde dehydrogenase [Bacteroidota bacterium]HIL57909.1 glutathione-dependent formaldehyde dehydrogenase [Rhodothermales bacterium]
MKALRWHGTGKVSVDTVDDPQIHNPHDCIIKTSLTAICGSDLHLYDGYIPTMEDGDILGHEFMGEVVEVGSEVQNLKKGDRVVVPFPIACGHCHYCNHSEYSLCDNSNRNAEIQAEAYGYAAAGIFGYSHMLGGYAGGQAEYVRVPYADVGPMKVPDSLTDEQVLFLTDIYPTGYQAAVNCDIQEGDTVVVWGCGPVGLFAQISAKMLGANVIGVDRIPERLRMAEQFAGSTTIDFSDGDLFEKLKELNDGRGPNACIDAVGLESHGMGLTGMAQKAEQTLKLQTDRGTALIEAIQSCGKGGTVSIPGVYGGVVNHFNIGAAFGKGLTFKMGQTHVHKYIRDLLGHIERGELDPSYIITHKAPLAKAPELYETFRDKEDNCVKVVLDPSWDDDREVEVRTQNLAPEA